MTKGRGEAHQTEEGKSQEPSRDTQFVHRDNGGCPPTHPGEGSGRRRDTGPVSGPPFYPPSFALPLV